VTTKLSKNQTVRQQTRTNGKYRNYPRCEVCNKTIPPDKYYSDERCNYGGRGLILCHKDATTVGNLTDEEYAKFFANGNPKEEEYLIKRLKERKA
jgi:hypothetical protein